MGLFGRRKAEAELIEVMREELAALRTELQTTMAETAAVLSVRVRTELEERMGEPSALAAGIQGVQETVAARDVELTNALAQVVEMCGSLREKVQNDRIERATLAATLDRLTAAMNAGALAPPVPPPSRPTVLGGSVDGGSVDPAPAPTTVVTPDPPPPPVQVLTALIETSPPDEIDLEAVAREPDVPNPPRRGRAVRPEEIEVRCRFGDRWVTGFEVCEVIRVDGVARYRLRRRSDGSVIPTLFDEKDLRFFSTAFIDPT